MQPSADRPGSVSGTASPRKEGVLVDVPVTAGDLGRGGVCSSDGRRAEARGKQPKGKRTPSEGDVKAGVGVGGPIRREKVKRGGASSMGGVQARGRKKREGAEEGGRIGEVPNGGQVSGPSGPVQVSPRSGLSRGGKGKLKGSVCCWGSGTDREGSVSTSCANREGSPGRVGEQEGGSKAELHLGGVERIVGDPSDGKGKMPVGAIDGKQGDLEAVVSNKGGSPSPSVPSPSKQAGSRSPARRPGNLLGGRPNPGGKKGGKEDLISLGHGGLVKKIRGAVLAAEGGGGSVVKEGSVEGGGVEPSER